MVEARLEMGAGLGDWKRAAGWNADGSGRDVRSTWRNSKRWLSQRTAWVTASVNDIYSCGSSSRES